VFVSNKLKIMGGVGFGEWTDLAHFLDIEILDSPANKLVGLCHTLRPI
jgi:hypothetical protein